MKRKLIIIIIIIIHEFHRDASLETKLQGRYVSHNEDFTLCLEHQRFLLLVHQMHLSIKNESDQHQTKSYIALCIAALTCEIKLK